MKTTIGPNGEMRVKAETDLEHYALKKWWEDWRNHKATLGIEVAHETHPNANTVLNVDADA